MKPLGVLGMALAGARKHEKPDLFKEVGVRQVMLRQRHTGRSDDVPTTLDYARYPTFAFATLGDESEDFLRGRWNAHRIVRFEVTHNHPEKRLDVGRGGKADGGRAADHGAYRLGAGAFFKRPISCVRNRFTASRNRAWPLEIDPPPIWRTFSGGTTISPPARITSDLGA